MLHRFALSVNLLFGTLSTANAQTVTAPCGAGNVRSSFGSGTNIPQSPCVPVLAFDQNSVTLVWNKPDAYERVVDYNVYMNGCRLGSANNVSASPVKRYFDAFYAEDASRFHTRVGIRSFRVTGLKPNTVYTFTVRSVDSEGTESRDSAKVVHKTAPEYAKVYDVSKFGAVGDGKTQNTAAIQKTVDLCAKGSSSAYGCKVLIPSGGTFLTGALFLRSNMTLEVAEGATLLGSANSSDYPLSAGYQIYSYFNNPTDDRRPPSLLNALSEAHRNGPKALTDHRGYDETRGAFVNIRVTGRGTLDGSGWLRKADIVDEVGNTLAQFDAGSATKWSSLGVLARSQMEAAQAEVGGTFTGAQNANFYSNRRSSLATFRGVRNIYFGDLRLTNPAFHGIMFLESENMVFADTITQTFDVNNADGVEFGNSANAVVFNNFLDTGDDCINFASGQGKDYEQGKPAQQFAWVFNNYLREGHGAIVTGSHTGAWIQDILAEDNIAFLTDTGLRIKSTPVTGGGVRRVLFRDIAMREVGTRNNVSAGGRVFSNGGSASSPFILTLSYSAGSNEFEDASSSARFYEIAVARVSVDNGNASTGGPMIAVDGYDGGDASLPYAETFHQNVSFAAVRIRNAKPASISRLKDSQFTNVNVSSWGKASSPWSISNCTALTFTNVTPMPEGL